VSRFLDGFSGSAFLSVSGGTIGDLFLPHELSAPMMLFTASPFLGSVKFIHTISSVDFGTDIVLGQNLDLFWEAS